MASKGKLGGATTKKNLEKAWRRLGCSEDDFLTAVNAAVKAGGDTPCPPDDAGCVSAQALPYIKAVMAGTQTRLPLQYIAPAGRPLARGQQPDRRVPARAGAR